MNETATNAAFFTLFSPAGSWVSTLSTDTRIHFTDCGEPLRMTETEAVLALCLAKVGTVAQVTTTASETGAQMRRWGQLVSEAARAAR